LVGLAKWELGRVQLRRYDRERRRRWWWTVEKKSAGVVRWVHKAGKEAHLSPSIRLCHPERF